MITRIAAPYINNERIISLLLFNTVKKRDGRRVNVIPLINPFVHNAVPGGLNTF